jgi:hypothetical protein
MGQRTASKMRIILSACIFFLCFFGLFSLKGFHRVSDRALSLAAVAVLGPASNLSRLGWAICRATPWADTTGNELLLFSDLCGSAAQRVFFQIFKESPSPNQLPLFEGVRPSHSSWELNRALFSQIPFSSMKEEELLLFLQRRWLAKSTGFYPYMIDWVCPCFGMCLQTHPETTSAYARNPCNKISETYEKTVAAWKKILPHPSHFPLILTRSADLHEYLPSFFRPEEVEKSSNYPVIVDFTESLPKNRQWLDAWNEQRALFLQRCKELHLDLDRIICIEQQEIGHLGGIRILPLQSHFADKSEAHFHYLLEWISRFGLTANRVELDRCFLGKMNVGRAACPELTREELMSTVEELEKDCWDKPHEALMVKGTLQLLKQLLSHFQQIQSPIKSAIARLSFFKLQDRLNALAKQKNDFLFFDMMEQIHADISSLVEVLSPFSINDFAKIYRNRLTIPEALLPFAHFSIHSSGMTSLAGIFKAAGPRPRVIYGENTYFECIIAAEAISEATPFDKASEEDFAEADILLAQFNPVLKRIDLQVTEYRVDKIKDALHRALSGKREKPITLALDCTLDYIDSPRAARLLKDFQKEIKQGILNVVCYRSGLKFDLFGMDNYCGAPFFMVHNADPRWQKFDALLNDKALVTDSLSLNWFCLAYGAAPEQLDLYRKQVFDNTRALLEKLPPRLFDEHSRYRVVPAEKDADMAFIDIKINGPLHVLRGGLAGGCLYYKCLEAGLPIFFRPSLGLYHPNLSMIFGENRTTIRLTLGLDPAQIEVLAKCFQMLDALNGSYDNPAI